MPCILYPKLWYVYPKLWYVYPKLWYVYPKPWYIHPKPWDIKCVAIKKDFPRVWDNVFSNV